MKYQVGFIMESKLEDNYKPSFIDYSWWVQIVDKVSKKSNNFEIRCWMNDKDAMETGEKFGKAIENNESKELVFKGKITDDFINDITNNYLDKQNTMKWFTLIFYCNKTMLFSSEHYGGEPYLFQLSEEDLQELKEWTKLHSCIVSTNIYEDLYEVVE